jgi:hypothetical protein
MVGQKAGRATYTSVWLVEVECCPWWVLLFKLDDVVLEELESGDEGSGWRWY